MNGSGVEDVGGLERIRSSMNEMVEYIRQSQARQQKFRLWNRLATIGILIVFVIYLFLFYNLLSTNLSGEKFTQSVREGMGQFAPVITDATLEVLTRVSPIYLELATRKADEIMPDLVASLEKQTDVFIVNMSDFARKELEAKLHGLVEQVAADFRTQYPDLTDEQIERFIDQTDEDFRQMFFVVSERIMDDNLPEIMKMKYLAESMSESERMPVEDVEIYRLFLHKLLLLLDMEIMEG